MNGKSFPFLGIITLLFQPMSAKESVDNTLTLVEESDRISDEETRYEIAKVLIWKEETLQEAKHHLDILLGIDSSNAGYRLLYANFLLLIQDYAGANEVAERLTLQNIDNVYVKIDLGTLQATLGNAVESRALFESIRPLMTSEETRSYYRLAYAKARELWGEWTESGHILKPLGESPGATLQQKTDPARFYQNSENNAYAEQIYRKLIALNPDSKALFEMTSLKLSENDFKSAGLWLQQASVKNREADAYDLLKGKLYLREHEYQEAYAVSLKKAESTKYPPRQAIYYTEAGIAAYKNGEPEKARRWLFKACSLNSYPVKPRFYLRMVDESLEGLPEDLIASPLPPQELKEWAQCFAAEGYPCAAIALLEHCVDRYPDYFPAYRQSADLYASRFSYDNALAIYSYLQKKFPDSQMILLQWARTLSWKKNYDPSLRVYERLIAQDPANPLYVLEKARVALWMKEPELSESTYLSLLTPSVDELYCKSDALYSNYEQMFERWNDAPYHTLWDGWGHYLIQKRAYLEMCAAFAVWNNLPFTAITDFENRVDFDPGNLEALYGYGQAMQAVGEICNAETIYDRMLFIDPTHTLAQINRERIDYIETPKIIDYLSVWSELGYGGLSEITRKKLYSGIQYPLDAQSQCNVFYTLFSDHPYSNARGKNFNVLAVNSEFSRIFNKNFSFSCALTYKLAGNYRLRRRYLGEIALNYRVDDYIQTTFGFLKKDEFYNYFGIKQGIQSDTLWGNVVWNPTRKLQIDGFYKYLKYTDHNSMNYVVLNGKYQLTEFPHILSISLQTEYRNTAEIDRFIYAGTQLVDIIHPYWSPQHYFAGRLVAEWTHDLADLNFIGAEKNYYVVRAMIGDDTDNNHACSLALEYHYEWDNRWSFQSTVLGHYSQMWKAAGLWSSISYAF